MSKFILIFFIAFFFNADKEKSYVIVAGDITCKACVIQLHNYLSKKIKKENLAVGLKNKGNIILNESGPNYYKKDLPKARFIFLDKESLFPKKEKYPYLLIVLKNDTLKIPYDSLFIGDDLNTRFLK